MDLIPHFIAGRENTSSERRGNVFNPATGEVQREVALATTDLANEAIAAAAAALPAWRATSLTRRTDIFFKLRMLLQDRKSELAAIVTSEHGKVLDDAAG